MTNAKKAAFCAILLLPAGLAVYLFIYSPIVEREFFRRYVEAGALSSTGPAHSPAWDQSVILSNGGSARILAHGGMGGAVEVLYGPSERYVIYRYVDYIYPSELKLSPDRRFLFATVSGLAGGIFERHYTYEFDLLTRTTISVHRLRSR